MLTALDKVRPMYTATVADHIWPGHDMPPQAAALAAGGILGRMQRRGLVDRYKGGWIRTQNDASNENAPAEEKAGETR
ncbi:MAG: hypothetical protein OXG44_00195 [Gammaproteobacteria bacterium]|nr:hypothetical protein [Gammaproteobacteria bacterium]